MVRCEYCGTECEHKPCPPARYNQIIAFAIELEEIKRRVAYNAHDLGEFGKMIRVEYVNNILDECVRPTDVPKTLRHPVKLPVRPDHHPDPPNATADYEI